jgi:hypothetical protein
LLIVTGLQGIVIAALLLRHDTRAPADARPGRLAHA